jgi:hypothetical protein
MLFPRLPILGISSTHARQRGDPNGRTYGCRGIARPTSSYVHSDKQKCHILQVKGHSTEVGSAESKEEELPDYFALLGVSTSATTAEIVIAYRHRAREMAGMPTSDLRYVRIKQAWDILSDPESRREYEARIKPDLYQVLKIGRDANLREIIASYRKLARIHHPGNLTKLYVSS